MKELDTICRKKNFCNYQEKIDERKMGELMSYGRLFINGMNGMLTQMLQRFEKLRNSISLKFKNTDELMPDLQLEYLPVQQRDGTKSDESIIENLFDDKIIIKQKEAEKYTKAEEDMLNISGLDGSFLALGDLSLGITNAVQQSLAKCARLDALAGATEVSKDTIGVDSEVMDRETVCNNKRIKAVFGAVDGCDEKDKTLGDVLQIPEDSTLDLLAEMKISLNQSELQALFNSKAGSGNKVRDGENGEKGGADGKSVLQSGGFQHSSQDKFMDFGILDQLKISGLTEKEEETSILPLKDQKGKPTATLCSYHKSLILFAIC